MRFSENVVPSGPPRLSRNFLRDIPHNSTPQVEKSSPVFKEILAIYKPGYLIFRFCLFFSPLVKFLNTLHHQLSRFRKSSSGLSHIIHESFQSHLGAICESFATSTRE